MQDIVGSLRRLTMRVNAMVCRSVINVVNDALETQCLQLTIMAGEVVPDVEHLEPYGMTFVPPVGSDALALAVKGSRGHTVAICAHAHEERPMGEPAAHRRALHERRVAALHRPRRSGARRCAARRRANRAR